jgi:hypothetical protein
MEEQYNVEAGRYFESWHRSGTLSSFGLDGSSRRVGSSSPAIYPTRQKECRQCEK